MAVFTPLQIADAERICRAHGLGPCRGVEGIPQGSVNSNYFVQTQDARYFLRIYEEQETPGVAYEWALLDHLKRAGIPVPQRVGKVEPGALRVGGKPVAIFECVPGGQSCQAGVSIPRATAVGSQLAQVHQAGRSFGQRKAGRFELDQVLRRLDDISFREHPELEEPIRELRQVAEEVRRTWPDRMPRGLIHGDLFRDNVHWEGDRIVAVLDWESASDGVWGYDLMVTLLAWCYGDDFDWHLAAALVAAYTRVRPMDTDELQALRILGLGAAVRFTVTRITDFHLRDGIGDRVHKDYTRFLARLRLLRDLDASELAARLTSTT